MCKCWVLKFIFFSAVKKKLFDDSGQSKLWMCQNKRMEKKCWTEIGKNEMREYRQLVACGDMKIDLIFFLFYNGRGTHQKAYFIISVLCRLSCRTDPISHLKLLTNHHHHHCPFILENTQTKLSSLHRRTHWFNTHKASVIYQKNSKCANIVLYQKKKNLNKEVQKFFGGEGKKRHNKCAIQFFFWCQTRKQKMIHSG